MNEAEEWLTVARSNFIHGKNVNKEDLFLYGGEVFFEELCFDLQQCVEKSFKAVLIHNKIKFQKTHYINELVDLLNHNNIAVPEDILNAVKLTMYAIQTRYPGDLRKLTENDYLEALEIAEKVYNWAKEIIHS